MTIECPKCQHENPEDSKFCKECGTKFESEIGPTKTLETPTEELKRGSVFAGRYEIIEELGKGGMGKVYRVEDKKAKEEIALKLIKTEIVSDKKIIERFRNELTTARKIVQKNVCRMYDLGEEKGQHYITMEYVPGGDLKRFIRRVGQLPIGRAISIAKQICSGLEEAHNLGIIHRDLKSNNIMIDDNGNAHIMDFGIARTVKEKGITGSGVMIGTPEFMSPEQVEAKKVDQRSDIYSLGIIMYEMVTGRLPFEADTPFAIGVKHKSESPKSPKELNPQMPDDLSGVILKCLEKDKENRYQSAGDVKSELERIEQSLPTTGRVVSTRKPITSREITVQFKLRKVCMPAFTVIAIVAVGLIIWNPWKQKELSQSHSEKPSLAVLPFSDLSQQKDQEYLCDGIASELITRLNKTEKINVPAQASSFSFKGKNLDVQEIGDELGVAYVLAGSLQKAEHRIRISVELVKVSDGFPIWTEKYERNIEDIFALQDEISLSIMENLSIELLGEEKAEFVIRHTQNPEAYNLFLKGLYFWGKRTADDLRKAIDYFGQAVKLDNNYALAYARLAETYGLLAWYSTILPKEVFTNAKSAVMRSLAIDKNLAEAHSALGFIKMYHDWDWEAAETEFKRSIHLKPGYVTARQWYAEYLTLKGRHEEALEEIQIALELDPLSLLINHHLGYHLYYARQYDKAAEQFQKTLELDSNYDISIGMLASTKLQMGMYEEAIAAFKKKGDIPKLGYAYARAGRREEAQRILQEMKDQWKRGEMHAIFIANIYNALDEEEMALEWLENSFARREMQLVFLKVSPDLVSLRSSPRYRAILKKMDLE